MSNTNVTLLGADGNLGPVILAALVSSGFKVTVLKRQSSKSPDDYPAEVAVARVSDDLPIDDLVQVLQGQDALVVTIKGTQSDVQKRLADACVKAGVKRFVPADFGSCDSASPLTQELVPLYKRKTELREYLQRLAQQHSTFSWTSVVSGHFFDWELPFIHIFLPEQRADILDDGEKKFSISTLARVGEATSRILQRLDETSNQILYVQSFCVTQNEIIRAFESATQAKWKVTVHNSDKWRDEHKAKLDEGDAKAAEECVWYLGTVDADWRTREGFAMQKLGLQDEDLDEVVKKVVNDAR